jgi:hypothetical protein
MVMKLQMKMKQKLGVAAIFALGFFVIIASSTHSQSNRAFPSDLPSHPSVLLKA